MEFSPEDSRVKVETQRENWAIMLGLGDKTV